MERSRSCYFNLYSNRRESSGGMEWLGVWNCNFSGSEFSNFGAWNLTKIALSAEFQGVSWKNRPLKNIFRTLENGHSIRHQSIPPLSAGRSKGLKGLPTKTQTTHDIHKMKDKIQPHARQDKNTKGPLVSILGWVVSSGGRRDRILQQYCGKFPSRLGNE